jgi:hypothetical protein
MRTKQHKFDFCVIGGGLSGMCAAIAAARRGVKVILMQDRPLLGGNASSEIRMGVGGARGENMRETGIIEEIKMENLYRNKTFSYSIWDSILYEKVKFEPNLTLLLNCSCNDAVVENNRIKSVRGWQLTSETWHIVEADLFADCSGDSILAPLSGAEFRYGREARSEFNESIEPEVGDDKTMGMSCLIQAREMSTPQEFIPPNWAHHYESCDDFPYRAHTVKQNFWWMEIGGQQDTVHDCEEIRDELLKIAFGVWDHIKNYCKEKETYRNWILDWVGFLPGKRESRRYVGDYIMTQNDVSAEGRFDDIIAYGGWPMDDHHPSGFHHPGEPTIFHPAPSPYGIPYRALYSKNIENLFFAGRNISATHAAMSSTRVMATCALLGQAIGTAAAVATTEKLTPREVYCQKLKTLQQMLMDDDCYLPWQTRNISELTRKAAVSASAGNPEKLRNGIDRPIGDENNAWECRANDYVEYRFDQPMQLNATRIVFDSNLKNHLFNYRSFYELHPDEFKVMPTLVKAFRIDCLDDTGRWQTALECNDNHQRLIRMPLATTTSAIRLIPLSTWGNDNINIFAWDVH